MAAFEGWEVRTVKVRKYRAGYEVRTERVSNPDNPPVVLRNAYTNAGEYIGDPRWARTLYAHGIAPQLRMPEHNVCSVGFCEREQKWYGWSHRAICGFGVGDVVKAGDCCAMTGWTEEYIKTHKEADTSLPPGFVARTVDDCKRMACVFAESVS